MTAITQRVVAITGGSGFIGRKLVQHHVRAGDQVRLLTRGRPGRPAPADVEVHYADLTEGGPALEAFVRGADVLYHCAGELHDHSKMFSLHVEGTRRLVVAAQGHVGRWIQLSSVGAMGPHRDGIVNEDTAGTPMGDYELTKALSDDIVSASSSSFDFTIVRPSIVFGPGMPNQSLRQLVEMVDRRLFFFVGPPGASANYIHVDNVVDALVLCGESSRAAGQSYLLSDWTTMEDFVGTIASCLGRPRPRVRVPAWPLRATIGITARVPGFPLTSPRIDALTTRVQYSADKIATQLGYEPSVGLHDSLRAYVASLQPHLHRASAAHDATSQQRGTIAR